MDGCECKISDKRAAQDLEKRARYIQEGVKNQSSELIMTSDTQLEFVSCCEKCDVYEEYEPRFLKPSYDSCDV